MLLFLPSDHACTRLYSSPLSNSAHYLTGCISSHFGFRHSSFHCTCFLDLIILLQCESQPPSVPPAKDWPSSAFLLLSSADCLWTALPLPEALQSVLIDLSQTGCLHCLAAGIFNRYSRQFRPELFESFILIPNLRLIHLLHNVNVSI